MRFFSLTKQILRKVIFGSLLFIVSMTVYACQCMGDTCDCGNVIHLSNLAIAGYLVFFIVLFVVVYYAVSFVGRRLRNKKSHK